MNRSLAIVVLSAACLMGAASARAEVRTSVDINVHLGDAPPLPVIFEAPPRVVVVPGSTVYYVGRDCDYDVFRYGRHWYVFNDGYWYRSGSYRGPFVAVYPRYVPRAVVNVPPRYWRRHPHGGPPGHRREVVMVKERPGKGRGNGHWK